MKNLFYYQRTDFCFRDEVKMFDNCRVLGSVIGSDNAKNREISREIMTGESFIEKAGLPRQCIPSKYLLIVHFLVWA